MPARAYIGTSGWTYPSWREHLYQGIPRRRWLAHAASQFSALEVNGSFYTQIKPETYRRWADETPAGFRFTVKGHRYITHYKRLMDVGEPVDRVMTQASALGAKLAAVVWQLPANFERDDARLEHFLAQLARWDNVRHALELRHRSWFTAEVAARLSHARVASCMSDAPDFPMWTAVTTDMVYVRLHGHTRKYASSYRRPLLSQWAEHTRSWLRQGRDVHVYFDNDAEGAAVRNTLTFMDLLAPHATRMAS
jgi:uncharacterized protein YecE (DUF72 family)